MSKDKNRKEKLMYWVSVNNWNQRMKVERKNSMSWGCHIENVMTYDFRWLQLPRFNLSSRLRSFEKKLVIWQNFVSQTNQSKRHMWPTHLSKAPTPRALHSVKTMCIFLKQFFFLWYTVGTCWMSIRCRGKK